jgi:alanine dehydrogenase
MVIGVPREIIIHEYRVALTPSGANELKREGHRVLIEKSAGLGSGFTDEMYEKAGAEISDKEKIFKEAELIVKVKEPMPEEYGLIKENQAVFTFLHLAPNPELTGLLLEKKVSAFAYETLEAGGALPLLKPMSEIAGRMSPLIASYYLQKTRGGSGILPAGAVGAYPANIFIIGAGTVGLNAVRIAFGIGMRVTVTNRGMERLEYIDELYGGRVGTLALSASNVEAALKDADIVIGAALLTGKRAPTVITTEMVSGMKKGSVIVDVSIDQGGAIETSRPTTHENPVFEAYGVIHYCVTNMPGAYPLTSTMALTGRTLPYIKTLASLGIERAVKENNALRSALNLYNGKVIHSGLRESMGLTEGD